MGEMRNLEIMDGKGGTVEVTRGIGQDREEMRSTPQEIGEEREKGIDRGMRWRGETAVG